MDSSQGKPAPSSLFNLWVYLDRIGGINVYSSVGPAFPTGSRSAAPGPAPAGMRDGALPLASTHPCPHAATPPGDAPAWVRTRSDLPVEQKRSCPCCKMLVVQVCLSKPVVLSSTRVPQTSSVVHRGCSAPVSRKQLCLELQVIRASLSQARLLPTVTQREQTPGEEMRWLRNLAQAGRLKELLLWALGGWMSLSPALFNLPLITLTGKV